MSRAAVVAALAAFGLTGYLLNEAFSFPTVAAYDDRAVQSNPGLRALDNGKIVTVPFPCVRDNADRWINSDLATPIVIAPVGWQIWHTRRRALLARVREAADRRL